jgi:hypothetical protein
MRRTTLLFILVLLLPSSWTLKAQNAGAPPVDPQEFLSRYEDSLQVFGEAYDELPLESLPFRNEWGRPLTRRPIDDRRRALNDLRQTIQRLRSDPQDLVQTTQLLIQSESLADDLFDLSRIAYDNDNEELGKRLSQLSRTADDNNDIVKSYALQLAEKQQARLHQLQEENSELLRKAGAVQTDQSSSPSR